MNNFPHHVYMRRALELAKLGKEKVSPNPMVGCVILHKGKIIGEGWHKFFGGLHAEPNAIASVENLDLLPESTMYVTLEPCAHHGKTPPCADLIIKSGIKNVIIASLDPNPLVAGKGVALLKEAGIKVSVGLLGNEAEAMNKRFFTFYQEKRPYIILKWAQTRDGFIAQPNFDSKWISNDLSRKWVHKWRSEEDAILVGPNTAYIDNPSLTTRFWPGKNPVRVLLDPMLNIPKTHNIFNDSAKTIVLNKHKENVNDNIKYILCSDTSPENILRTLHKENIQSLIIEGGTGTINYFLEAGLWDEARVFTAQKKYFVEGLQAPSLRSAPHQEINVLNDKLHIYYREP